jgi:hypothetical protein
MAAEATDMYIKYDGNINAIGNSGQADFKGWFYGESDANDGCK